MEHHQQQHPPPARYTLLTLQQHQARRKDKKDVKSAVDAQPASANPGLAESFGELPRGATEFTNSQIWNWKPSRPRTTPNPRRSKPEGQVTYNKPSGGYTASVPWPYRARGFGVINTYPSARNINRENLQLRLGRRTVVTPTRRTLSSRRAALFAPVREQRRSTALSPTSKPGFGRFDSESDMKQAKDNERTRELRGGTVAARATGSSCTTHTAALLASRLNICRPPPIICPSPSGFAIGKAAEADPRGLAFDSPAESKVSSEVSTQVTCRGLLCSLFIHTSVRSMVEPSRLTSSLSCIALACSLFRNK